jgi:hypothetical protein
LFSFTSCLFLRLKKKKKRNIMEEIKKKKRNLEGSCVLAGPQHCATPVPQ